MGLVKAIDRFDAERTTAFSSYAIPTMVGELKRYFRDFGWAVHVPRGMQERTASVQAAVTRLSERLGRSPTAAELARQLDLGEEEVTPICLGHVLDESRLEDAALALGQLAQRGGDGYPELDELEAAVVLSERVADAGILGVLCAAAWAVEGHGVVGERGLERLE